jgi:hypothetical protein
VLSALNSRIEVADIRGELNRVFQGASPRLTSQTPDRGAQWRPQETGRLPHIAVDKMSDFHGTDRLSSGAIYDLIAPLEQISCCCEVESIEKRRFS